MPSNTSDADGTKHVTYIWSKEYEEICDCLPSNIGRSSRIHSLIRAYGLDKLMKIEEPNRASTEDLCTFHDSDYIEFLLNCEGKRSHSPSPRPQKRRRSSSTSSSESSKEDAYHTYGLEYDCPPFTELLEYVLLLGGAALRCASLLSTSTDLVIHWDGGRHHALRSSASGYCYLADIPLSIQSLLTRFKAVLYVDLDVHHGDGVEFAFAHTEKVITLSFHVHEPGFYPGTGDGKEKGRGVYNVPMPRGTKAPVWEETVKRGVTMVWERYLPDCLVLQCGCDGLLTDPHRGMSLTTHAFTRAASYILELCKVPTLILGGGGYHPPSTAKHFALLTATILGKELDEDIPVDAEYWEELEHDGGIHVGRDTQMPPDGEEEIERLCEALRQNIDKH